MEIAQRGFEVSGLWPSNDTKFDNEFVVNDDPAHVDGKDNTPEHAHVDGEDNTPEPAHVDGEDNAPTTNHVDGKDNNTKPAHMDVDCKCDTYDECDV